MDREQEIRLNFLDEAESYLDQLESVLLTLNNDNFDVLDLDLALRAAHSLKGGAGMMGFFQISQVSHRLEDFLKILRIRYESISITQETETLLLHSVDSLRNIVSLHHQGKAIDDSLLQEQVSPIFEGLRQYLGELNQEDENNLFALEQGSGIELQLFEEEVDRILNELEQQIFNLSGEELSQTLIITIEELNVFSQMAELETFTQLCQSIQQQTLLSNVDDLPNLANLILTTLKRSYSLVLLKNLDEIPTELDISLLNSPILAENQGNFPMFESQGAEMEFNGFNMDEIESFDLDFSEIQAELDNIDQESFELDISPLIPPSLGVNQSNSPIIGGRGAKTEFNDFNSDEIESLELDISPLISPSLGVNQSNSPIIGGRGAKTESLELDISPLNTPSLGVNQPNSPIFGGRGVMGDKSDEAIKMVKIPAKELAQFNRLFGKLILERNTVNTQLEEVKNFASLLKERMLKLEQSHTQLIKWYDRASIEGLITTVTETKPLTANVANGSGNIAIKDNQTEDFDILEMDRYTDLHIISQDQIETIVQLQEVSTDIQLGLLDVKQSMGEFNRTTTELQKNITRTQMTPFADVVKGFPRMVRDLSLQFNKQVKLIISGEATLIDRVILDKINSPLNHLLRNAFDHGIENTNNRIAKGKPPEGKITLSAVNRGNQTIITIKDDGGGISLERIKNNLLQKGISKSDIEKMSEKQILNYIFEAGFSTKETVTELSGRGIGMDVVRTNIREIRGDIQVNTKEGIGTTFIINIPFSLSVLRVMLLEKGSFIFAVPINTIKELKSFTASEITTVDNQDYLDCSSPSSNFGGDQIYSLPHLGDTGGNSVGNDYLTDNKKTIPVVDLEQSLIFNRDYKSFPLKGNALINKPTLLMVGETSNLGGIYIDRVWGEQEVTIYSIDTPIPLPRGFNSSIIIGDGRVVPLVDPIEMLQGCLQKSPDNGNFDNSSFEDTNFNQKQINRILIVDDSINVRNYLAFTLEKAGYEVEEAKDGREAVDKLFNGLSVKAVISDMEMPRLDGYGLLKEVKGKGEFKHLPIIMLTSRSNEKHRKLAFNLGANAYFSKPYNEQELLQKLEELTLKT